jgi:hypothetical protein
LHARYWPTADGSPSLDTHLIAFQDKQLSGRIRTVPVYFLALTGRIEVVLLSFDTPLQLVLPRVVPEHPKGDDNHSSDNDWQEHSPSHLRTVLVVA